MVISARLEMVIILMRFRRIGIADTPWTMKGQIVLTEVAI